MNIRASVFWVAVWITATAFTAHASEETASFGRFGTVTLYHRSARPAHVILFVSGDGGWNQGVVDMARELSTLDALVVGVDIRHYLRELAGTPDKCDYPAADFEALSKFVQQRLDFPVYVTPLLVGYSSGATLVYATLVQAPPNTFLGAISMGFCPDLLLNKPLCRGDGLKWEAGPKGKGYIFLPAETLEVPWVVLQGSIDQVCDPAATVAYAGTVKNARLVDLPKVGHGFSVPRNWMPQLKEAFAQIVRENGAVPQGTAEGSLKDLPLIEVPAADSRGDTMAVVITGDGGWGVTDRGIAQSLAAKGIPAVGWNSLHYYWKPKSPEQAAEDLTRILQHYLALWKKESAVLVGYSLGADVLPFLLNRVLEQTKASIKLVVLIGLGSEVDFQVHLTDWLGDFRHASSRPVLPEVEKLRGLKIYCFYGEDDRDSLCGKLPPGLAVPVELKTGHRIGEQFQPIVDTILREVR